MSGTTPTPDPQQYDPTAGVVNNAGADTDTPPAAPPETVTVNSGPQSPQPDTTTPNAGQVPQVPQQPGPTVLVRQHRGGLAGIVDEFRDAVAGTQGRGVWINPETGERFVQHPDLSGKQQWMKIASEALGGAASGLAAGKGAGNQGKALAAGVQFEQNRAQQQKQQQDEQAEQDYNRDKQARLAKAQSQLLTTEIAKNEFALTRMKQDATEEDIKFSQEREDREKALGSSDLGTYPDHYSLADVKKQRPEFWQDHYRDNTIVAVPSFDGDGKRQGVHLYLRQPGIGQVPVEPGTQAMRFVPPAKPGDKPTLEPFTPAGTHTQDEIDTYNNGAYAQYQKYQQAAAEQALKESETGEHKAQTANQYAEAGEHRERTKQLQTGPGSDIDTTAQMVANGDMAPSQVPAKSRVAVMGRAAAIAAAAGKTFSPEDAENTYKARQASDKSFASGQDAANIQSFGQFLGHSLDLSESVNTLRNTNVKLVNTAINDLKGVVGNAAVTNFLTQEYAARKEFQNFLNNNHALLKEDVDEGKRLLSEDMTPAQLQGVMKQFARTASIRMSAVNEKYKNAHNGQDYPHLISNSGAMALQHFGINPSTLRGAPQAPPGATTAYKDAQGNIKGWAVNGQYVAAQ